MQILEKIQGVIERTYDLESGHRVSDFVVTCPKFAHYFGLRPDAGARQEQVLVRGDSAAVDLAVCLNEQVLERLRDQNPMASLHDGNLEAFWTALEGVSHFVYLVWNASRSRQVTQLELELQAEVDKFVTTALLVAAQQGGRVPTELHSWLFDLCRLDETLARGIDAFKTQLDRVLEGQEVREMPHEAIIEMLDQAGRQFSVLLFKSNLALPYTSLFLRLECGYWDDDAEKALRRVMKKRLTNPVKEGK